MNLRSIFVLTACAAVGMALGSPIGAAYTTAANGAPVKPSTDLLLAVMATLSAAMVVGLTTQAVAITRIGVAREYEPARRLAMAWRFGLAILLVWCLAGSFAERRGIETVAALKQVDTLWGDDLFPTDVWWVVLTCGLLGVYGRVGRPQVTAGNRLLALALVAAVAVSVATTINTTLTHYLVHIAIQGIEDYHPARFRRSTLREAEQVRVACLAAAALVAYAAGAAACLLGGRWRPAAGALLCGSLAFVVWYYAVGLAQISLDLAEALALPIGPAAVSGLALLGLAAAYAGVRFASSSDDQPPSLTLALPPGLHEQMPILVLLGIGVGGVVTMQLLFALFFAGDGYAMTALQRLGYLLSSVGGLVTPAIVLATIAILVARFRRPERFHELRLASIRAGRFWRCSAATAAVLLLGAALVPAAAFCLWLLPWHRWL
ncbi:MAG: hypothetical protein AAFV43_03750 [Planctomycetota bacterium]